MKLKSNAFMILKDHNPTPFYKLVVWPLIRVSIIDTSGTSTTMPQIDDLSKFEL